MATVAPRSSFVGGRSALEHDGDRGAQVCREILAGRATSSGVDDALATVRGQASDAAIALQRIPIEYSQAVTGSGGESTRTITEAIARARDELDRAWADAPWFGPAARRPVDATLSALDRAVAAHVSPEEFQADVDTAVRAVEAAFGVSISPSS
jgi:hypothetical protein